MRQIAINPKDPRFLTDNGTSHFDRFGYSAAVRAGQFLYVAGQIGLDLDGTLPASAAAQIAHAFERLKIILETAQSSLSEIVELVTYHVDIQSHFADFLAIKQQYLSRPYPTWSAIEVAGLARRGLIVEIKAVAYSPE